MAGFRKNLIKLKLEFHINFKCHEIFLFFKFFPTVYTVKLFLGHGLHKHRWQVRFSPWAKSLSVGFQPLEAERLVDDSIIQLSYSQMTKLRSRVVGETQLVCVKANKSRS